MERFVVLPAPLLKLILVFAGTARHDPLLPLAPSVPHALLDNLKRSHAAWEPVVEQLRSELDVSATLTLQTPHDMSESVAQFAALAARPVPLKSLTLMVHADFDNTLPMEEDECSRLWCEAFTSAPQLERLELHSVTHDSALLPTMIKAASRVCTKMKALVVELRLNRNFNRDDDLAVSIRAAVYEAMERWQGTPNHGGLQQLEFVRRYTDKELRDTVVVETLETEFYENVAQFCPRIEFLNMRLFPATSLHRPLTTTNRIPREAWESFSSACVSFRAVDWIDFPYTDRHFELFARTPKPRLERILIRNAEGEHTAGPTGRSLYSTAGMAQALGACINLKDLRVEFAHSLGIHPGFHRQWIWNDELLTALSQNCMRLQSFCLRENDQASQRANIPTPLETITDAGVSALATLPELRTVKMKATCVTGRGVFELLRHAPTWGLPRKITLDVGCLLLEGFYMDDEEEQVVIFYDVVHQVLQLLVDNKQEFKSQRFTLKLKNRSRSDPDTDEWREKLHQLIQAATTVKVQLVEDSGRLERVLVQSMTSNHDA